MNNKGQSHFRARVMDLTKPIPIYRDEEVCTLHSLPAVTRMVQDIPTGMEKNEEKEVHLIQAIDGKQPIPVPGVEPVSYRLSPYIMPKHLIQFHPFPLDEETPDYDADTDDEAFVKSHSGINLDIDKFEKMMATFETSSTRKVLTLEEARSLMKDDMVVITTVYEYWLNKRLQCKYPLIPVVPTESRLSKNQAYVAFRKRIDKRVTRRNRRNDENSYYRMLRLKADLEKVVQILGYVKQREVRKRELIKTDIDILDLRYRAQDFNDTVYRNVLREEALAAQSSVSPTKRKYTKQHKKQKATDRKTDEDENNPFVFRRKLGCSYLPPVSGSLTSWEDDNDSYQPATVDGRTLVLARRRFGRGGRIILDRRVPPYCFYVDSSVLAEIQSNAVGEFRELWLVDLENLDDGASGHFELSVQEFRRSEEKEVIHPRGKKSFAEHLSEIGRTQEENQESSQKN